MPNRFELAHLTWPILVRTATDRTISTYGEIAAELGYRGARPVNKALDPIQELCREKGWPPLTILVVNQQTGRPGPGFIAWPGDFNEGKELVYNHDWQDHPVPFQPDHIEFLERIRRPTPPRGGNPQYSVPDQYVEVNGRGPFQVAFRNLLLRVYHNQCALCDSRLSQVLVASHIVPWSLDRNNRLNPRNGLLLCRTHDALFESGNLLINTDYSIRFHDINQRIAGADLYSFVHNHTRPNLRLPNHGYRPLADFLRWRLDNHNALSDAED